jgi:uncharacterized protein
MIPHLSLLVKPVSGACNLCCAYCFYRNHSAAGDSGELMTQETLECLVKKALEAAGESCTFAFQGGEPSLAGLPFFRKFIELVRFYKQRDLRINYALQTNGTLMDEEWADFLVENRFLTGLSLDGPRGFHDALRQDPAGRGSFNRVMETASLFNRRRVEYNILCVVNGVNARQGELIYSFFKRNHFHYLQFIPCLDPWAEPPGGRQYSLKPEWYARFLKAVFDEWYRDLKNDRWISIRYFENLAAVIRGYPPELCGMAGFCVPYSVIESDGSVYPCDFYVSEEWRLGNIRTADFKDLLDGKTARLFAQSSRHACAECENCQWYALCRGGCRRNREFLPGETNTLPGLNYYCPAFKDFFAYAAPRLGKASALLEGSPVYT